jgi:hypothetical protein
LPAWTPSGPPLAGHLQRSNCALSFDPAATAR